MTKDYVLVIFFLLSPNKKSISYKGDNLLIGNSSIHYKKRIITFDDLKFDLVPCKYKALYKPNKQGAIEKQTLALKKIISDSLKDNVK